MESWYISSIEQKKRGNMDIYKKTLKQIFGEELSWSEVKELPRELQMRLLLTLRDNITESQSPIAINKLARAILNSRSGAGGCAMTEYECAFCGEKETWGNTNVPRICGQCASDMAKNIVLQGMNIMKD